MIILHLYFSFKYLQISKEPKVIWQESKFWITPKCHNFPIFPQISGSNVGFTDSDSATRLMRDISLD